VFDYTHMLLWLASTRQFVTPVRLTPNISGPWSSMYVCNYWDSLTFGSLSGATSTYKPCLWYKPIWFEVLFLHLRYINFSSRYIFVIVQPSGFNFVSHLWHHNSSCFNMYEKMACLCILWWCWLLDMVGLLIFLGILLMRGNIFCS
jgi:hypothetical protein